MPLCHEPLPPPHRHDSATSSITVDDSLVKDPGDRFDLVLTNLPFGKKSSITFITDQGVLFEGGTGEFDEVLADLRV